MFLINKAWFNSITLTTPTIGTVTPISQDDGVDRTTYTFATHNSSTGNLLVLFCVRSNTSSALSIATVKWNTNLLTAIDAAKINGVGRNSCWAGYIKGSTTGTQTLENVWTPGSARDLAGYIIDISAMATVVIGDHVAVTTNTVKDNENATMTAVQDAMSLLVGCGWAGDGTVDPLSGSAGWTDGTSVETSTGATNVVGQLVSRTAGSTGSMALTISSDAPTTTDDWSLIMFEVLPV